MDSNYDPEFELALTKNVEELLANTERLAARVGEDHPGVRLLRAIDRAVLFMEELFRILT